MSARCIFGDCIHSQSACSHARVRDSGQTCLSLGASFNIADVAPLKIH